MDISDDDQPPDRSAILLVGQDIKGHWLVQDRIGRLEGCFVSRETALGFARAECGMLHATVQLADSPLTPRIAF
jgi:hypothetical protein